MPRHAVLQHSLEAAKKRAKMAGGRWVRSLHRSQPIAEFFADRDFDSPWEWVPYRNCQKGNKLVGFLCLRCISNPQADGVFRVFREKPFVARPKRKFSGQYRPAKDGNG